MISASSALYNYFNQNIREEGQEIEIKISKSGRTYTITDDDLVASSVKITKKSVSGASFDIGECYVDSATFTINKNINNYKSLTGAKVTITIRVNNADLNIDESVLLGTFRILQDGIKRTNTLLQVTADSYISKFDKSRKRATFTGDLYDLITDSCSKCKVTFGMSESAFRALSANVAKTYEIKKDSSLKTHRDVVMYVAQLIGGFATTTPEGALIFKNYTSSNDICNVNDNVIVNYSIGDEVYNLSGLGMSVNEQDVVLYRSGEDDDSPYFLNLDTNPLLENCTNEEIANIVGNIWEKLISLDLNNFSFDFNGNPLIEVGDIISIPERHLETYVASYEWTYHGKENLSCVSVDKTKRIETQREKQNANKPKSDSDKAKDDRVDTLIKDTTVGTKKIKKKHSSSVNYTRDIIYDIRYANNKNIGTFIEPIQVQWESTSGNVLTRDIYTAEIMLQMSIPILGADFTNEVKFLSQTLTDNDIVTIDFQDARGIFYLGFGAYNPSAGQDFYIDVDNYTGNKTYQGAYNNNINLAISELPLSSKIYELDAIGNILGEVPNFTVSIAGNTEEIDSNIKKYNYNYSITSDFSFKFKNIFDLMGINYESFEDNILTIKMKDLKVLGNLRLGENVGFTDIYNNGSLVTYRDYYYKTTTSFYNNGAIRDQSFENTKDSGGFVNAYYKATWNRDIQSKIESYKLNNYNKVAIFTYETEENESYTVDITGTSDKINDTKEKTEENTNEIDKLKKAVNKLKTNVTKISQKVTSLTNKVGSMSNSLGVTKTDVAKLDNRVTNLENSGSSGGETSAEDKKQIEQNKTNISNLDTKVTNLQTTVNNNVTAITGLTTRVTNLENGGGSSGDSGITEEEKQQIQTNKTDIANLKTRVTNLENNGGSGGSGGSGITETERQQIQTNKQNIENLTLTVNGHTTSIEDILKRLSVLEQGGGGDTGESLKFTSFDIKFNKNKSRASSYFPNFDINNYKIDDTYYLTETNRGDMTFYLVAGLNKVGSSQTFRKRTKNDSSEYTIIDKDTLNIQSSDVQFINANNEFYFDCESSLNDLYAKSKSIHVKTYRWVTATRDTNWVNETTGDKPTAGAHAGDIINLKTEISDGFKALNLANAPSELNKYYYKILFSGNSTSHNNSNAIIAVDWTPLDIEPDVLTDIRFTFESSWGGKTVNLFISDGQYVIRADYDKIPLLT